VPQAPPLEGARALAFPGTRSTAVAQWRGGGAPLGALVGPRPPRALVVVVVVVLGAAWGTY
jgi:hypothetical protein